MRILFYDHYNATMGGIEKLIITLAIELSAKHEVVIISDKYGTICKALSDYNTEYIHVDPDERNLFKYISHDDLLIDFGTFRDFVKLLKINPKFLMWRVFPSIGCSNFVASFLQKITLKLLEQKDSLVFMDRCCHETACTELNYEFIKRILPLPIISQQKLYCPARLESEINITYIGRGDCIWKVKPVKKIINDLATIKDQQFIFHIFTDTDDLFRKELNETRYNNIAVKYHFGYTMNALSSKLIELSDLHYSMGTSCLEGAAMGIPTIIADASYDDFPTDYQYRWLVDDYENYAGVFLENEIIKGRNIFDIINSINDLGKLDHISDRTYQTTLNFFSSKYVLQTINNLNPKARISDILKFMPSYWFQKLSIE